MTNNKMTKKKARTGKKIEITDMIMDDPVSTVAITGLPIPAVDTVEASLVTLEVLEMSAAVPPPAIIAKAQVISGLISTIVDAIIIVPAIVAKGTAILSNKLSI